MTADLATRLRARSLNFKIGSPVDELLREAADAIDLWRDRTVAAEAMVTSLTAERDEAKSRAQQAGMSVVAQDRLFDDLQDDLSAKGIELADTIMRLAVAEAERDNLVIAVTRCNDEHVLKSDLAAAELHLFSGHGCDCRHMAERKAAYLGATEAYSDVRMVTPRVGPETDEEFLARPRKLGGFTGRREAADLNCPSHPWMSLASCLIDGPNSVSDTTDTKRVSAKSIERADLNFSDRAKEGE